MGEFNYDGSHSIRFLGTDGKWYDTWEDFHMAPKARPFVAEPPVKTNYIDVPGANGSLDYTEALTGTVMYGMRTGQWDFIVDQGYGNDDMNMVSNNALKFQAEILKFFHGKKFEKIILSDSLEYDRNGNIVDGYFYTGRITAKINLGVRDFTQVTLQYNLDPYKYPVGSTKTMDWKWAELFGNTIIYGKFTVNGSKARTIYTEEAITATINVSNPMTLTFGSTTTTLNTGDNEINLAAGANLMSFDGFGLVTVDYARGKSL